MDFKVNLKVFAIVFIFVGPQVSSWNVASIFKSSDTLPFLNMFKVWMVEQGKTYTHILDSWMRYKVFKDNMVRAVELNLEHKGRALFGPTQFADLTTDEFIEQVLQKSGLLTGQSLKTQRTLQAVSTNNTDVIPENWDWVEQGVVSEVKNQGFMGTCYIFTAIGVLESQWAIKGNDVINLSVEQVADCHARFENPMSTNIACGVCGGLPESVFWHIQKIGGIMKDKDYGYCAGSLSCMPCPPKGYNIFVCGIYPFFGSCKKQDSCQAKLDTAKFVQGLKIKDYFNFVGTEDELVSVLYEYGPLSVGVDAVDIQLYETGILKPDRCRYENVNHAVLLVGYGTEAGENYWKIKNSWGPSYGEKGYFRIERGGGACGILRIVNGAHLE